ncbi:MAG TPA: rhodanese-like domain-containing protein [Terriglobia bacterium]|nr:rhodanese-like domain-containing protein [Terriglobia bacterium]
MDEIQIEPQALSESLQAGENIFLLDCREPWEYESASIAGSVLIPMGSIPQNLDKIPSDRPVVVICHSGMRSLDVAFWLRQQGIQARSLSGGIDQWSQEIDPSVPRY